MKKILCFSLFTCSIFSMQLDLVKSPKNSYFQKKLFKQKISLTDTKKSRLEGNSVFIPQRLGQVELYHDDNGFSIHKDSKLFPIPSCFIDKELRGISKKDLARLIATNAYLAINEIGQNEYSLKLNRRLLGGGIFGATIGAFLGKAAVSVIGHGTIFLIGGLTGPACPYTIIALESCFGAAIESASMAGAVAGGMALGVATGPV